MNFDKKNMEAIVEWINNNCSVNGTNTSEIFKSKIDFLERALEQLRIENKYLDNKLEFNEFIQGKIFLQDGKLNYETPPRIQSVGAGTTPIQLQAKLLMFLLLNHKKAYQVYDIIENFVIEIWDQLSLEDFKRTRTGVTRCFTNTRFAANTLRSYGLLNSTKKEAYKTWTLSLYGLLVASKMVQEDLNWRLTEIDKKYTSDLHPDILDAANTLKTYDDFVNRLAAVCESKKSDGVFKTFDSILKEAYKILDEYRRIIRNTELSKKDRQTESKSSIKQLENLPDIDEFHKEFSVCLPCSCIKK